MDYDINKDGVTQTLLATYKQCRTQAAKWLAGWEKPGFSEPLTFGNATHAVLEDLYNHYRVNKPPKITGLRGKKRVEPIVEEVAGLGKVWLAKWLKHERANLSMDPKHAQYLEYIEAVLPHVLPHYVRMWGIDDFYGGRTWLELESKFAVDFHGIPLRGLRDGVYSKKGLMLLENKTKGQIDQHTLSDTLSFDFQNLFYITATNLDVARHINGVLYNIIRRPQLRLKKNEQYAELLVRIGEDIAARPDHYFVRYPLTYNKTRQKLFVKQLGYAIDEFHEWLCGNLKTFPNEFACVGRYTCQYLQACAQNSNTGYTKRQVLFPELEGR